jgi:hypothetical protein
MSNDSEYVKNMRESELKRFADYDERERFRKSYKEKI